jgi:hypothetical protein
LWDECEFITHQGKLPGGELQQMDMAERVVLLQNKGSEKTNWAREIRKRSASGHQTSIITINFLLDLVVIGLYMFARWSQENFISYMMKNIGIDTLVSYLKTQISDTATLINIQYRALEAILKNWYPR